MWCDNPSILSATNFPVQGNGAVIGRIGTVKAVKAGLPLISNLHDALYAEVEAKLRAEAEEELRRCMDEAVREVLDGWIDIRIGMDWHPYDVDWVEPKGRESYQLLGRFLKERMTDFV